MNKPRKRSPLVNALLRAGSEFVQADVKERLEELQQTPLGEMVNAALQRRKQIEQEGREADEDDVYAWLQDCKRIVGSDEEDEDDCQP